jgi:hypothetical protein
MPSERVGLVDKRAPIRRTPGINPIPLIITHRYNPPKRHLQVFCDPLFLAAGISCHRNCHIASPSLFMFPLLRNTMPIHNHQKTAQTERVHSTLLFLNNNLLGHRVYNLGIKFGRLRSRKANLLCQIIRQKFNEFPIPLLIQERVVDELGFLIGLAACSNCKVEVESFASMLAFCEVLYIG